MNAKQLTEKVRAICSPKDLVYQVSVSVDNYRDCVTQNIRVEVVIHYLRIGKIEFIKGQNFQSVADQLDLLLKSIEPSVPATVEALDELAVNAS